MKNDRYNIYGMKNGRKEFYRAENGHAFAEEEVNRLNEVDDGITYVMEPA